VTTVIVTFTGNVLDEICARATTDSCVTCCYWYLC